MAAALAERLDVGWVELAAACARFLLGDCGATRQWPGAADRCVGLSLVDCGACAWVRFLRSGLGVRIVSPIGHAAGASCSTCAAPPGGQPEDCRCWGLPAAATTFRVGAEGEAVSGTAARFCGRRGGERCVVGAAHSCELACAPAELGLATMPCFDGMRSSEWRSFSRYTSSASVEAETVVSSTSVLTAPSCGSGG